MTATGQFCTFYVNKHFYGIEVSKVQEVIRYQEMTRVPLAPRVISGLINLRGQIVTAIDLGKRMGLRDHASNQFPMNVVVRSEDSVFSLLVDEIGDVLKLEQSRFEIVPDSLHGTARELIYGAYKLNQQILLLLNCEKLFVLE